VPSISDGGEREPPDLTEPHRGGRPDAKQPVEPPTGSACAYACPERRLSGRRVPSLARRL